MMTQDSPLIDAADMFKHSETKTMIDAIKDIDLVSVANVVNPGSFITQQKKVVGFQEVINNYLYSTSSFKINIFYRLKALIFHLLNPMKYYNLVRNTLFVPLNSYFEFVIETINDPMFLYSFIVLIMIFSIAILIYYAQNWSYNQGNQEETVTETNKAIKIMIWLNSLTLAISLLSLVFKGSNPLYELLSFFYVNILVLITSVAFIGYHVHHFTLSRFKDSVMLAQADFISLILTFLSVYIINVLTFSVFPISKALILFVLSSWLITLTSFISFHLFDKKADGFNYLFDLFVKVFDNFTLSINLNWLSAKNENVDSSPDLISEVQESQKPENIESKAPVDLLV